MNFYFFLGNVFGEISEWTPERICEENGVFGEKFGGISDTDEFLKVSNYELLQKLKEFVLEPLKQILQESL